MASFFDDDNNDKTDTTADFFADFTSNNTEEESNNNNNNKKKKSKKSKKKKKSNNDDGFSSSDTSSSSSSSSSDSDDDDDAILAQFMNKALKAPNDEVSKRRGANKPVKNSPTQTLTKKNNAAPSSPVVMTAFGVVQYMPPSATKQASNNKRTGHKYSISFDMNSELDIVWETDWRGKLVRVKQFRLIDSLPGPASDDGRIKIGHTLLEINGKPIPDDFHESILYLKTLTKSKQQMKNDVLKDDNDNDNNNNKSNNKKKTKNKKSSKYTLRFFSPDDAPISQNALALKSVMKEVHLHKIALYRAQSEGLTKGFIERYRGDHMTTFHLHRESDNKFICGVSCKKNMQGDFIFHTLVDMTWDAKLKNIPVQPSSATYLGRMVKNYMGTSFTLHDYRVTNPHDTMAPKHQLATMVYKTNVSGGDPNAFTTILPRYDEEYLEGEQLETLVNRHKLLKKRRSSLEQTMMDKLRRKKDLKYGSIEQREEAELLVLQTQKPVYDDQLQAYTLDFDGRVKMPCKRNFILSVDPENQRLVDEFGEGTTLLRHGKVNEDRYCLDYRYPLSPVQALAISLTSFADKLLVT